MTIVPLFLLTLGAINWGYAYPLVFLFVALLRQRMLGREGALNFFLALCVVDGMVSAMMRRLENDPNSEESVPDASNLHADL